MILFITFCTDSRLRANAKEELLLGRPWVGPSPEDEKDCVYILGLKTLK